MKQPSLVPVILSGGAGTRLWPLSREASPKPFMPLPDGADAARQDGARARWRCPASRALVTVTNREHYFETKDVYAGAVRRRCPRRRGYLLEPFGRNTAPAVALAALARGGAARRRRRAAGAAGRPPDPRPGGVRRRRRARRGAGARPARSSPSASRRRGPRPASATSNAARRSATRTTAVPAYAALRFVEKPPLDRAKALRRGRQLRLELGHVLLHRARDPRGLRAATRPRCSPPRARRCPPAAARGEAMLEIDADGVRRRARHLDRLRGDGAGGRGRRGRRRARQRSTGATSARGRPVADLPRRDADGNRGQGERVLDRHAQHLRPRRGPRGGGGRRRQPRRHRHAPTRCWSRIATTCSGSRTSSPS